MPALRRAGLTRNSHATCSLRRPWRGPVDRRTRSVAMSDLTWDSRDNPDSEDGQASSPDRDLEGELLVVYEPFLRDAVAASLRFLGFEVATADSGADALRLARDRPFDLLVLDVMLPDTDGFEVVRRLRRDGCHVPAIFLTARDTQADKVTGLTLGGDDYMTKPFGLEELAARIRTVLRRTRPGVAGPGADQGADPRPRLGLRLRRVGHRRGDLHRLPAAQAGQVRARGDPHPARGRLPAAPAPRGRGSERRCRVGSAAGPAGPAGPSSAPRYSPAFCWSCSSR